MHTRVAALLAALLSLVPAAAGAGNIEPDLEFDALVPRVRTPDGKRLLSATSNRVSCWDLERGGLLWRRRLTPQVNAPFARVLVSGDGALAAVLADGNGLEVQIVRASDGELLHSLPPVRGGNADSAAFAPASDRLWLLAGDSIHRIDAATGEELAPLPLPSPGEDARWSGLRFGPGSEVFFLSAGDEAIAFESATGAVQRRFAGGDHFEVAGETLLVCGSSPRSSGGRCVSYRWRDGKELHQWMKLDLTYNKQRLLSPDGKWVALYLEGATRVDSVEGTVLFRGEKAGSAQREWSDDGSFLWLPGRDSPGAIWKLAARKKAAAHEADGAFLLSGRSRLRIQGPSGAPGRELLREDRIERLALSDDERYLALGGDRLRVFDLVSGAQVLVAPAQQWFVTPSFHGGRLLVTDRDSGGEGRGRARIFETGSWRLLWEHPVEKGLDEAALSDDGQRLALLHFEKIGQAEGKFIEIFAPGSKGPPVHVELPEGFDAWPMAFSADGSRLAVGSIGEGVALFAADTGALVQQLDGDLEGTLADGRFLLAPGLRHHARNPVMQAMDASGALAPVHELDFLAQGDPACPKAWDLEFVSRGRGVASSSSSCRNAALHFVVLRAGAAPVPYVAPASNPRKPDAVLGEVAIFQGGGGPVRIAGAHDGQPRATLFLLGESDWALATEDGRYDGTPAALEQIRFRVGDQLVQLAARPEARTAGLWQSLAR